MPRQFPEQSDPTTADSGNYADEGELSPADRALLESATAELARDPADRQPGTIDDDDDLRIDVGTQPVSDVEGLRETSGYEETEDGLDDIAETVRREAEDRPTGEPDEDFAA
ncbi:hypothetical protein [Antarcticirhabdus aurantiaca]|uniref:Uncharacterized protein n=1 Tax=Antarcticirhabdus aurantiaca TaxID=2606717 RepID=A0ACD4NRB4_9HYPH|nr:hypothetical protein [Antarcticirhabdus aurantiaca]WAJ29232.1 hypothetical protein OXU80_03060 [Jeongeuplla avenae]